MTASPLRVGVVGVGSMGSNHARVYRELQSATLVGVADADAERAETVAEAYDTQAMDPIELLDAVDAVSIVVPTSHHVAVATEALRRDVDVLVEKPFVVDVDAGRELVDLAEARDLVLQVGHIERFNPAIRTLSRFAAGLDVLAMTAMRLGPPVARHIDVNPVLDLMIHDIDIMRSLVDAPVESVSAAQVVGEPYVSATLTFETGVVGTLLASRVTQQKVRTLSLTTPESHVTVDYISQSVDIHRQSLPEYLETESGVGFRHQSIVERPATEHAEPLKLELESFLDAVRDRGEPEVTGADGLAAVEIAGRIMASANVPAVVPLEAVDGTVPNR